MRGPEALRPGDALTRVLEHAGDRVAVLQADGRDLGVQVADAGAAAAPGDRAVVRRMGSVDRRFLSAPTRVGRVSFTVYAPTLNVWLFMLAAARL